MKHHLIILFFISSTTFAQKNQPTYKNAKLPIEQRANDLLSRMTTEEKFWQLFMIPSSADVLTGGDDRLAYKNGIFCFQLSAASQGGGFLRIHIQPLNSLKKIQ
jgi:beta-glucosidase